MRLFRGVSLYKSVVNQYRKFMTDKQEFRFNGFTSTSVKESVARRFAKENAGSGKVPCLLIMEVKDNGENKAYLHSKEYSAFPHEKEVLLGYTRWIVKNVTEEENGMIVITLSDQGQV